MPKRILIGMIPSFIKSCIKRKEAKNVLYDLPGYIYRATDEHMLLWINFPESDRLLSRAYLIIHDLEKGKPENFYHLARTDIFNFLIILRHRLEDHLQEKKPHPLAAGYLVDVNKAIEKVRFILSADENILPDPKFLFIECAEHWQHS